MTVLDVSSYDLDTFDPQCFAANGVTGIIPGVYSPTNAPNRMAAAAQGCRDAGIEILGFYGFVYFGSPYGKTRDTRWAIDLAQRFGVDRVWLDAETDGIANGFTDGRLPTPAQRVAELAECVALVEAAGLKPGIYTGGWWWPSNTGNSHAFMDLPLWHSAYADEEGGYSEVRTVDYGGWRDVAIHQWTSTRRLCGRVRDHNHYWLQELDEVTQRDFETLMLAVFSGAEDRYPHDHPNPALRGMTLPREERIPIARDRMERKAAGESGSVSDRAESAIVITGTASLVNGDDVPEHTHEIGKVVT